MAKIILVNGTAPISVKLRLDMQIYCAACKALVANRAALKRTESSFHDDFTSDIDLIRVRFNEVEQDLLVAEKVMKCERDALRAEITGIAGNLHWLNIKMMLSTQCNLENLLEKKLFFILRIPSTSKIIAPLAIECLDNSFVELLTGLTQNSSKLKGF